MGIGTAVFLLGAALQAVRAPGAIGPPKTPVGLSQCVHSLQPVADLPRLPGETIRYVVDMSGLSVGTIDFKIERRGTYAGRPVTEYRSLFKLDSLVATFVPVEGRAAALVPERAYAPLLAMNRYRLDKNEFAEDVTYDADGSRAASTRKKNGKATDETRVFPGPAQDFVSAFYLLRSLPADMNGCAIIYGNQRAYTIWVKSDGQEEVKTPVGLRRADRYQIRYGSEKSPQPVDATLWLGEEPDRLPYQAEIRGKNTLQAHIHLYAPGHP